MAYDARGSIIEVSYFDNQDQPTRHKDGYAVLRMAYDIQGNLIEANYLDDQRRPIRHKNGYAMLRRGYDTRNNVIEASYFDEQRQPTRHADGYAILRRAYDARDNVIEEAYFDEHDQPTRHKDGYAMLRREYDARGNISLMDFYPPPGERLENGFERMRIETEFDALERMITRTTRYLSAKGDAVADELGRHKTVVQYDGANKPLAAVTYDGLGEPVGNESGIHRIEWRYDEKGNEIRYFDVLGQLIPGPEGGAIVRTDYDENARQVRMVFFDDRHAPTDNVAGFAVWETRYSPETGNASTDIYWDAQGRRLDAIVVRYVRPNSHASKANIKPGDVVLSYNGFTVNGDMARLESLLKVQGDNRRTIIVSRDGKQLTL